MTSAPQLVDDDVLAWRDTLRGHVHQLLEMAAEAGAHAAEATVRLATGLDVSVRMGEVETLEHQRDRGIALTVYFGHRQGTASTSDFSVAALRETVAAACRIARYTAEDVCAGLADAELMAREWPALDLYHPWDLDVSEAIDQARACEAAARGVDERISNSEGATLSSSRALRVYGNSHGFTGEREGTRHMLGCAVIASDDRGMQRDGWYSVARHPGELASPGTVGRQAGRRALSLLGARRLPTQSLPVLYAPEAARGLLGHFVSAVSGGALFRHASFLCDSLGEAVFSPQVSLVEQPHVPRALGSAGFDGEGVATRERDLVRDGVLQGYVLDSYAARRLGMQTTANAGGVRNLTLLPGSDSPQALCRQMGEGLVVTRLMGQGVNTVTGDYSRGATGFHVVNGEQAGPVQEITIAGNLRDMFRNIMAVASDMDERGNIRTPSLLVDGVTVAGE